MRIHRIILPLFLIAQLAAMSAQSKAQALAAPDNPSPSIAVAPVVQANPAYTRPTERMKLRNYTFDTIGPLPIIGVAIAAGINQESNAPPEWNQGLKGYGRRFGSDFGIATVSTTTRYALAEAFREDTVYYRCECTGFFPRLKHAAISTVTSRRGEDGHRVFSFPSLAAPYAGPMVAVYGWFPSRFGAEDAFRMGNYNLLVYVGGNIGKEFFHRGSGSFFSHKGADTSDQAHTQGASR
jgi:hypothetical protein